MSDTALLTERTGNKRKTYLLFYILLWARYVLPWIMEIFRGCVWRCHFLLIRSCRSSPRFVLYFVGSLKDIHPTRQEDRCRGSRRISLSRPRYERHSILLGTKSTWTSKCPKFLFPFLFVYSFFSLSIFFSVTFLLCAVYCLKHFASCFAYACFFPSYWGIFV